MNLIIVESPTKAKTFNKILDPKKYLVFATMGHIRDLPGNKLSIDYNKQFAPNYQIIKSKQKIVTELKKNAKKSDEVILATDPDREGESIAYHVAYIVGYINEKWPKFNIKKEIKLKRIVFHEITEKALFDALSSPESLRINLVKAQQTRRILDRIVGYELSPLLWKKIGKNWLSAGRVQTVVLRLIVEREKEIKLFKPEEYFQIYGYFLNAQEIRAKLAKKDGLNFEVTNKIELFDGTYQYTKTNITKENYKSFIDEITADQYTITNIKESVATRYPLPPFTTSLLQQDAFNRFGFSSKMTMMLAQNLYEQGSITYHRTDSFNLSQDFLLNAKKYIDNNFGFNYSLATPRFFKTKSKSAQEAHEAIRPTKLANNTIKEFENKNFTHNHHRLYQLIFDRAVATQMAEAKIKQLRLSIEGQRHYLFESEFNQVIFDGFLKLINPKFVSDNQQEINFAVGTILKLNRVEGTPMITRSPPRYNEASLIKSLEEKGIGRPSTYAPIISLIQDKYYVEKIERYFSPTQLGTVISDYLSSAFPKVFDLNFTAQMEDGLDRVANGEEDMIKLLCDFYNPFKIDLSAKKNDTVKIDVQQTVDEKCPVCSKPLIIRFSKFGRFLGCSGFPGCKFTKPYLNFVQNKSCPKCAGKIVIRYTKRKRRFYGCENYPKCDYCSWKL